MSNDPVGFRDVHSFNRYAYANNNPYKYVDPDGEEPQTPITTIKFGGRPLTLEGPFKKPPTISQKAVRFALSKGLVEKLSHKIIKVDLVRGAIVGNPIGLAVSLILPAKMGNGECPFGPNTCGDKIRPLWTLFPETVKKKLGGEEDAEDNNESGLEAIENLQSLRGRGANVGNTHNSFPDKDAPKLGGKCARLVGAC
jgi:hypothetical protein